MSTLTCPPAPTSHRLQRVRNIRSLHRGDAVEVRSGNEVYFCGEIHDTAPGLGTLWIRDADMGSRIAVSLDDYTIWKVKA